MAHMQAERLLSWCFEQLTPKLQNQIDPARQLQDYPLLPVLLSHGAVTGQAKLHFTEQFAKFQKI